MSDLVQRLREEAQGGGRYVLLGLFAQAADRIDALERQLLANGPLIDEAVAQLEADEVLLRQALEALEAVAGWQADQGHHRGAVEALRERLGEKP